MFEHFIHRSRADADSPAQSGVSGNKQEVTSSTGWNVTREKKNAKKKIQTQCRKIRFMLPSKACEDKLNALKVIYNKNMLYYYSQYVFYKLVTLGHFRCSQYLYLLVHTVISSLYNHSKHFTVQFLLFTHISIQCIYMCSTFLCHTSLTHCRHSRQGQSGVQPLAQGHFSTGHGGHSDQTDDLLVRGRSALPPEPRRMAVLICMHTECSLSHKKTYFQSAFQNNSIILQLI